MSLTSIIKEKGIYYQALKNAINLEYCVNLIEHQNKYIPEPIIKPPSNIDFSLSGLSIIYALRDYLFGKKRWNETVAGQSYDYPNYKFPERWIMMAFFDSLARGRISNLPNFNKSLPANYNFTIQDVYNVAMTFKQVFGSPKQFLGDTPVYLNPTFAGSISVGGADANMIIGNTLWKVKTTVKHRPLTLDDILQQIGYVLLDSKNKYNIKNITWYYTRQKTLFTHPVEKFLSNDKKLIAQKILISS